MIKLSELPNETMICKGDIETGIMSKETLLSDYPQTEEKIYLTIPIVACINFENITDMCESEQYEDWAEDITNANEDNIELQNAIDIINKVLAENCSYEQGEEIENDMIGEVRNER